MHERGSGNVLTIATILLGAILAIGFPVWMLVKGTQKASQDAAAGVRRAEETRAEALLVGAAEVARSYSATTGSFEGFSPQTAAGIDPSFSWSANPVATPGTVSIRGVASDSLVLVTAGPGYPMCLAIDGGETRRGTVDARTAADCVAL